MNINLYNKLEKYLDLLSKGRVFYGSEEIRSSLKKPALELVPLFCWLAEVNNKKKESKAVLEKFKSSFLVDSFPTSEDNFSNKSEDEIADEINYLKVCVQNICNIDLDQVTEKELLESPATNPNNRIYENEPDSSTVYRNFFNEDFEMPDQDGISQVVNSFLLKSHAWDRLNKDIKDGFIYIYKEKPKRNILIKYLLLAFYLIGIFLSLSLSLVLMVDSFSGGSSGGVTQQPQVFVFSLVSIVYFCFLILNMFKSFTNDNFKYSFQKRSLYLNFIFSVLLVISFSAEGFLKSSVASPSLHFALLVSLLLVLFFNCFLYLFAYLYLQPKKDKERIEAELTKHMSDISKSEGLVA